MDRPINSRFSTPHHAQYLLNYWLFSLQLLFYGWIFNCCSFTTDRWRILPSLGKKKIGFKYILFAVLRRFQSLFFSSLFLSFVCLFCCCCCCLFCVHVIHCVSDSEFFLIYPFTFINMPKMQSFILRECVFALWAIMFYFIQPYKTLNLTNKKHNKRYKQT